MRQNEPLLHLMTLSLVEDHPPEWPSDYSCFVQFDSRRKVLTIRGDVSEAPTLQILEFLADSGTRLRSPCWTFSLDADFDRACVYTLTMSTSGDRRDLRLLNDAEEFETPSAPRSISRLKAGADAIVSKSPSGPFALVGNNLLASTSALKTLSLIASGGVRVKGELVRWHVIRPPARSILDPQLSFSPADERPYRSHLANIARSGADLTFGLVTDKERWGIQLEQSIYLIDRESAERIIPSAKRTLGDITLKPVFPADSPEGKFLREVTKRVGRLKISTSN